MNAAGEWVGRCASCRWSVGSERVGRTGLVCTVGGEKAACPVRYNWTCVRYEYEPGAAA